LAANDNNNLTGFVERWSRRKLAAETAPSEARSSTTNGTDARLIDGNDQFVDFDFNSLDFNSDFKRFMSETVPDGVRNRALQILWASNDIIGRPDELDDYLEDFSEEAMAVPAELARSAYRIGRGFVENSNDADGSRSREREEIPDQVADNRDAPETDQVPGRAHSEQPLPESDKRRAETRRREQT
jgi:hypothetical protein